ncbi:sensor histidine kinase [Flexithrix dorotheae]|uniref:sensor histidine kinase n=1 Tax=Flexithrix dorotheae TaxID=70993 RepID=UPI0003A86307|nr:ATP-binding protein [Flexithrix dorotheae]
MVFKGFRLRLIFRVTLLVGVLFLLIYSVLNTSWLITPLVLLMIGFAQLAELIYFLEAHIREVSNFLLAIKHKDFSGTYSEIGKKKSSRILQSAFNEINAAFKEVSTQKELHYLYLQTIVEHVGVALICFKTDGEVTLMNDAAVKLLQLPYLRNIQSLKRLEEHLPAQIISLEPGQKVLVKLNIANSIHDLSISGTVFKLEQEEYKLISLQNISSELEGQEVISWQKLIRVLNHEIMNSVTPIISLSGIIHEKLDKNVNLIGVHDIKIQRELAEILKGIGTISNRSKGLLNFVKNYRSLTSIKPPQFEKVEISLLFDRVMQLLSSQLEKNGISLSIEVSERNLAIKAGDIELLEQVLINLILNSRDALHNKENAEIILSAKSNGQKVIILVTDNGKGIPKAHIENIFTPFFSTKKEGSGIGLSLSRQILFLHKGTLAVSSELGKYTSFRLEI